MGWLAQPAICMAQPAICLAHEISVSAQGPLVLGFGLTLKSHGPPTI